MDFSRVLFRSTLLQRLLRFPRTAPIEFRWKDSRNMATAISANKAELLAIADAVAREKLIDRDIVIEAMEDAIQRAARSRYGAENDIRAKIDPKSGDMRLWREIGRAHV